MSMPNVFPQSLKGALSGLPMIAITVNVVKVQLADFTAGIELLWSLHYTSPFLMNV
jgi:hypothetical protein